VKEFGPGGGSPWGKKRNKEKISNIPRRIERKLKVKQSRRAGGDQRETGQKKRSEDKLARGEKSIRGGGCVHFGKKRGGSLRAEQNGLKLQEQKTGKKTPSSKQKNIFCFLSGKRDNPNWPKGYRCGLGVPELGHREIGKGKGQTEQKSFAGKQNALSRAGPSPYKKKRRGGEARQVKGRGQRTFPEE